jgi:hypothetical protein
MPAKAQVHAMGRRQTPARMGRARKPAADPPEPVSADQKVPRKALS